ncbi:MAG: fused MFS/spermidine synthase [Deltaproteobacteria bacterium]|nr:fused MFS/spermidine synthase [Deltaproteobacteria bacterium]
MRSYYIIVFIAGAVVLSLELVASRVMTPYFGVSLYIWASILSVTLLALSLGYFFGGILSNLEKTPAKRILFQKRFFIIMPSLTSLFLPLVCLIYPSLFYSLAGFNLVVGSILASLLILFLPLFLLSAMSPLLIAMASTEAGSGGHVSGRVFFVSTIGSVVGVFLTAFLLVPNATNLYSMLILSGVLSLLALWLVFLKIDKEVRSLPMAILSGGGVVFALLVLMVSIYMRGGEGNLVKYNGLEWKIEKEYTSVFGNLKVITTSGGHKALFNDGIYQALLDKSKRSSEAFTYALETLTLKNLPEKGKVLVLGLGAGIVPMRFLRDEIEVDVVELNPSMVSVATDYFGFDSKNIEVFTEDARTFVRGCDNSYDALIVDLFRGDGTPDHLLSREFFRDASKCLSSEGFVVMNTFAHSSHWAPFYSIVKTLKSVFPSVTMYHDKLGRVAGLKNVYLLAFKGAGVEPTAIDATLFDAPKSVKARLSSTFDGTRPLDSGLIKSANLLTDEDNNFSYHNTATQQAFRKSAFQSVPPSFLLN